MHAGPERGRRQPRNAPAWARALAARMRAGPGAGADCP